MYSHIAFDMDGTLFSSENMILPAYNRGITAFNKQNPHNKVILPPLKNILSLLGLPIIQIYNTLFPNLSLEEKNIIRDLISYELIKSIINKEGILFHGVSETLNNLHSSGYKLFIASNGLNTYLETILKTYNLFNLFEPIITLNNTS
ncbi:MAG: HAD family hydrolase, partial [Spirochaetota bacterium]|nr:HAD family hydrolase [Spirochaetota bacterium]